MNTTTAQQTTTAPQAPRAPQAESKKAYIKPHLTSHGRLTAVTAASAGLPTAGF